MCFQRTTTIIRVNPSKNNSTEIQNLLEIPQIPPAINRISLPSQSTAPEESLAPIFVASEQGLDTSVYKRVFKPPRLKSQILGLDSLRGRLFACGKFLFNVFLRLRHVLQFLRLFLRHRCFYSVVSFWSHGNAGRYPAFHSFALHLLRR